jgi:hypothetical protein
MIRRFLYKLFGWRAYIPIEAWRQRREFNQYAYRDAESAYLSHFVNRGDVCLDVGAEMLALRGAVETIGAYQPKLLLEVETAHTQKYGYKPQDIFAMLAAYGYRDVYCTRDGALARLDVAPFAVAERPFPTLVEAALGCLVNNFFVTP